MITLAGALLAFFLVFYGWRDLRYALSSGDPLELGTPRWSSIASKATAGLENRYVRVAGTPDRESALELDTKGSWVFSQLFRVLGTGDRLFVHRLQNPLPADRAEADVFEGRLIRIDELPYADAIRGYFAKHVVATHYFAADARLKALAARAAGARRWRSSIGAATSGRSRADEALAIEVVKPDRCRSACRGPLPDGRRRPARDHARGGGEVTVAEGPREGAGAARRGRREPARHRARAARALDVRRAFPAARRQAALDELGDIDRAVEIRDARETIAAHADELAVERRRAGRARPRRAGAPAGRRRHRRRSHDGPRRRSRRTPTCWSRAIARAITLAASSSRWCWWCSASFNIVALVRNR